MERLEVSIERLAFGGKGLGRVNGLVVFVEGAIPGDRVEAIVTRRKRTFAEARIGEVLEPSPHRQPPPCEHLPACGGCAMQHVNYAAQLLFKKAQVAESFERIGHIREIPLEDPVPANPIFFYRNKMEFTFASEQGRVTLGLHRRGSFRDLVATPDCLLQSQASNRVRARVVGWANARGLNPYDKRSHEGDLRHLVIREGKRTGQRMLHLFATRPLPQFRELISGLPEVTTALLSLNRRRADAALADRSILVHGAGIIEERVNHLTFAIAPDTFFQTNTFQAEKLYRTTAAWAAAEGAQAILDLYAGLAPIGLHLAGPGRRVLSIESNPHSVQQAKRRAAENGVAGLEIRLGEVEKVLPSLDERPDLVVVDPPRAGLHPKTIKHLLAEPPPALIYVSCNPATLARDCAELVQQGRFSIEQVRPFDMFPHTHHVETLVRLKRKAAPL